MPLLERLSVVARGGGEGPRREPAADLPSRDAALLMPALISAFLIAFTLSFDEYAIASFLAGNAPTWPVYLFAQLRVPSQLPQLLAVSSVVLLGSLLLVLVGRDRPPARRAPVRAASTWAAASRGSPGPSATSR